MVDVFYFTDEPVVKVLEKAKVAAGRRDVRISGGASVIQQFLRARLVDEFTLHIANVLLGKGLRVFEGIDRAVSKPMWSSQRILQGPHISSIWCCTE